MSTKTCYIGFTDKAEIGNWVQFCPLSQEGNCCQVKTTMNGMEQTVSTENGGGDRSGKKRKASNSTATEDKSSKSNLKKPVIKCDKENFVDENRWTAEKGYSNFVEGSVPISYSNTDQRQVNNSQSALTNDWPSLNKNCSGEGASKSDSNLGVLSEREALTKQVLSDSESKGKKVYARQNTDQYDTNSENTVLGNKSDICDNTDLIVHDLTIEDEEMIKSTKLSRELDRTQKTAPQKISLLPESIANLKSDINTSPKGSVSKGLAGIVSSLFSPTSEQQIIHVIQTPVDSGKIDTTGADAVTIENNAYLKDLAKNHRVTLEVLNGIRTSVETNSEELSTLSERLELFEIFVDTTVTELTARMDQYDITINELKTRNSEMRDYIDDRVNSVTAELPDTLARMGKDVDERFESTMAKIESMVNQKLDAHPKFNDVNCLCDEAIKRSIADEKLVNRADLLKLQQQVENIKLTNETGIEAGVINEMKSNIERVLERNKEIEKEMIDQKKMFLSKIEDLKKSGAPVDGITDADRKSWEEFRTKTEKEIKRIAPIEAEVAENKLSYQNLDLKSRKSNVIIEQLIESEYENTLEMITSIFDHALPEHVRSKVDVIRAFRLGPKSIDNNRRKILVELSDSRGKELVLEYARQITSAGNDGNAYYINEDLPPSIKRRKNDIYKYIKYMERRGHNVTRAGDDIVLDGTRHKVEDLNKLPIGNRLLDSRTIFHRGVVAFQSSISPLSNLFPTQLKYNNMLYKSAEHCYQYLRAIHHNEYELANSILMKDDPYDAMTLGKKITHENNEWFNKKLGIMRLILRHKAEQCTLFRDVLRSTGNHRIAENSWSLFWGTGCAFCINHVWNGTFRGANHLGRLLEQTRDYI